MTELDHILLDQLHSAKRDMARIRRMKLWMNEPLLNVVEHSAHGRIKFFESMIQDKTLLKKRKRRKREKDKDILYKHPVVMYYRNTYMFVKLSYRMVSDYLSLWNKKEEQ